MSRLSFTGRELPMTLRLARSLVFVQACLLVVSAALVMLVAVLLGSGNSVSFAGANLSGGAAAALAFFYLALGVMLLYFGVALARRIPWTRNALVGLEAVLIVFFFASGDLSLGLAISVCLCVAVAGLLVTSSAGAAFSNGARSEPTEATSPGQQS